MGNTVTKNAFRGYNYQGWVYNNFIYKMDLNRFITEVDVEIDSKNKDKDNFDDIYIKDKNNNEYYIQVKNIQTFDINKVKITNDKIKFGNQTIKYNKKYTNIIVIYSNFKCDTEILNIKAKCIKSIYFIPLTIDNCEKQIGKYYDIKRKEEIDNLVDKHVNEHNFLFTEEDIPPLKVYSIKLNRKTVLLKNIPSSKNINIGIHWCIGEPGIGKSHLVKEFETKLNNDCIIYRLHTDNKDRFKNERLTYDYFLRDLSYKIFNKPKFTTEKEIIKSLEKSKKVLIIDGLDHVENYNPHEFNKYISFIEKLSNTKTLIFSRPLKNYKNYKKLHKIRKWSKEETEYYLTEEYHFKNEKQEIYNITNGYPIITYYLAEHIKNGGTIKEYSTPIDNITDYYDTITKNISQKSVMRIFLTIPTYILKEEFYSLLDENLCEIFFEFKEEYPYLFNEELNRISLFHDSFNNYLKNSYKINKDVLEKIKKSILSKNIEYLSRFNLIQFDDKFIEQVLKIYSNFDTFSELSNNFDFESIKLFYIGLKEILPKFPNILDIYQYYSLILITILLERHDYHYSSSLFYNLFYYGENHHLNETNIYSNGVMWSLYVYYKTNNLELYKNLIEKNNYNDNTLLNDIEENWNYEKTWSLRYDNININSEEKVIKHIMKTRNYKLFEKYLAYIYIKKVKNSEYYTIIYNYINNTFKKHHQEYYENICTELGFDSFLKKRILENAKIKIYERGCLKEDNIFLKNNLKKFMKSLAHKYSCDIYEYLLSYIRLYNHLNKDFDYREIFKYLNMYLFRKDYSVINLDSALIIFEKHNCIKECDSITLIKNTMQKSEKGIRHLLTDYLNKKDPEIIPKINKYVDNLEIDLNRLKSDHINKIKFSKVDLFLRYNIYDYVNYYDIEQLLNTKYKSLLLNIFKYNNILIKDVPKDRIILFKENNIQYTILINKPQKKFEERNYIIKSDSKYIDINNTSYLELSTYLDINNQCLPYINLFEKYDKNMLRKDCLKIIHNAISTKDYYFKKYSCIWYSCLGTIPQLLDLSNYTVNWEKLYHIFQQFLNYSSIYY